MELPGALLNPSSKNEKIRSIKIHFQKGVFPTFWQMELAPRLKISSIFSKKKIFYISGNGTFLHLYFSKKQFSLYFGKGNF